MDKDCDKVWQDGLIHTMDNFGLTTAMMPLTDSYTGGRTLREDKEGRSTPGSNTITKIVRGIQGGHPEDSRSSDG